MIHLVDGTFELFRAFYGGPRDRAPGPTDAVAGLARSLMRLVTADRATHVAVAFDHIIESFRNELFDGYKTSAGIDVTLAAQFGLAEEAARALGFVVWPMIEFEADDAIGTAAARFAAEGHAVVIASPDKDFAQCVQAAGAQPGAGEVTLWDRIRDRRIAEPDVLAKWGVPPASIPDWLALVGDTSDGIPGLAGFGEKTASALLARFGHLEAIPDDAAAWGPGIRGAAGLAATLSQNREAATLYRTLATLRRDVPLTETADDLLWRGADRDAVAALAHTLGDPGLPARIPRFR